MDERLLGRLSVEAGEYVVRTERIEGARIIIELYAEISGFGASMESGRSGRAIVHYGRGLGAWSFQGWWGILLLARTFSEDTSSLRQTVGKVSQDLGAGISTSATAVL